MKTKLLIFFLSLLLIILIYKCTPLNSLDFFFRNYNLQYSEKFENKLNDNYYIINIFPNINNKLSNKYIIYSNNKSIIENDNNCKWCFNSKFLKNIIKKNFNKKYDFIEIKPINGYMFKINYKGNKNKDYIFKKIKHNTYQIFKNKEKIFDILDNNINNKRIISIRDINFNKVLRITYNTKINDTFSGYNNIGIQYICSILNNKIDIMLGFSIFQLINEINRDKYL